MIELFESWQLNSQLHENIQEPLHVQLFENYDQVMRNIQFAIENKMVCIMDYKGEQGTKVVPGTRYIEPYTLGYDSKGNTMLRAWLIKGISRSGRINPRLVPGWRMFRVDRTHFFNPTMEKFTVPRKGYNPEDKNMTEVTVTASF
jgi:hypothetical protein